MFGRENQPGILEVVDEIFNYVAQQLYGLQPDYAEQGNPNSGYIRSNVLFAWKGGDHRNIDTRRFRAMNPDLEDQVGEYEDLKKKLGRNGLGQKEKRRFKELEEILKGKQKGN